MGGEAEDTNHSGIVRGRIKRRGKTSHRRSARRFIRAAKLKIPIVGCNENFGYRRVGGRGAGEEERGRKKPVPIIQTSTDFFLNKVKPALQSRMHL